MQNLQTYNRVKTLDNKAKKNGFIALGVLCLSGSIASALYGFLLAPEALYLIASLVLSTVLLSGAALLIKQGRHLHMQCQFCHSDLEIIDLPFQFKNRHITGAGLKLDDQLFEEERVQGHKQWVRRYQWALACHHCRLYETTYSESFKLATPREMAKIHKALSEQKSN
jgi:hypothetical protein